MTHPEGFRDFLRSLTYEERSFVLAIVESAAATAAEMVCHAVCAEKETAVELARVASDGAAEYLDEVVA